MPRHVAKRVRPVNVTDRPRLRFGPVTRTGIRFRLEVVRIVARPWPAYDVSDSTRLTLKKRIRPRMVTREQLKNQIHSHLDGTLTIEDLAAWAEDVFRTEEFEADYEDMISEILATIRDAIDPHRFRWEEPDFEEILDELEETEVS